MTQVQTQVQATTMTIADARKLVKEGFRAMYDVYTGSPAWWETPDAEVVRKMVAHQAKLVLAQQAGERAPEAPKVTPVMPKVEAPVVPVVEVTPEPAPELLDGETLFDYATRVLPTHDGMTQKEKKAVYARRTTLRRKLGLAGPGLKAGQVVFGTKA